MTLPRMLRSVPICLAIALLFAGCGRKTDPRAQEGYDLVLAGKIDEAIALTNLVLADEPDNASARMVLGLALYKSGDAEGSIVQYRRATEAKPDYAEAWFNLGNAYRQLEQPKEAEAAYATAIRHEKDFVLARFNLGKIFENTGRVEQAIAEYRKCVELDGQFLYAYIDLGEYYYANGDFDRAVANLSRALELEPGIKEVRVLLGNAYMQVGVENNLQLAENEFRAAMGIDPAYVDAVYSMGVVLATQNRTQESIEYFEKVLEMVPADDQKSREVHKFFEQMGHTPPEKASSG